MNIRLLLFSVFMTMAVVAFPQSNYGTKKVTNNNGTETHVSTRKCVLCRGTGECSSCDGTGLPICKYASAYAQRSISNYYSSCPMCGGNGKCRTCGGSGIRQSVMFIDKKTGHYEFSATDGSYRSIGNINENKYSSDDDDYEDSNNTRRTGGGNSCIMCDGKGEYLDYVPTTLDTWYYCSYCKKRHLGKHRYVRCRECRGTGVIK